MYLHVPLKNTKLIGHIHHSHESCWFLIPFCQSWWHFGALGFKNPIFLVKGIQIYLYPSPSNNGKWGSIDLQQSWWRLLHLLRNKGVNPKLSGLLFFQTCGLSGQSSTNPNPWNLGPFLRAVNMTQNYSVAFEKYTWICLRCSEKSKHRFPKWLLIFPWYNANPRVCVFKEGAESSPIF